MHSITSQLGQFYGLDWLSMFIGVSASISMTTKRFRLAFVLNILACIGGLAVAWLSGQTGFILYNAILIGTNFGGLVNAGQRGEMTLRPGRTRSAAFNPSRT